MDAVAPVAPAAPAVTTPATTPAPAPAPVAVKADAPAAKAAPGRGPDGKFQPAAAKADAPAPTAKSTDPAPTAAEVKAEMKRLLKLTVDGQTEELDLDNPEHLTKAQRAAQIGLAKEKRFEESKKMKEEASQKYAAVNDLLETMMKKPAEFAAKAKALGIDPLKLATSILQPEIEAQLEAEKEAALSPEQKRVKELERKLADIEAKEAAQKAEAEKSEKQKAEAAQKAAREAQAKSYADTLQNTLKEIENTVGIPVTDELAIEIVSLMEEAVTNGLPLDPKDLAADVAEREMQRIQRYLAKADDTKIGKILPKPLQDRINRAQVEEFKKSNPMLSAAPPVSAKAVAKEADAAPKAKSGPTASFGARFARLGMQLQNGQKAK